MLVGATTDDAIASFLAISKDRFLAYTPPGPRRRSEEPDHAFEGVLAIL